MMEEGRPRMVRPGYVREDDRGLFVEILAEGPWETIIHGTMQQGKTMGNHYHRENKAFFYLVNGSATIRVKHLVDNSEDEVVLRGGEGIFFLPFEVHTITYLEKSDFVLLKSYAEAI